MPDARQFANKMSFTERQLHCLEAMGFVAWTSGDRHGTAPTHLPASLASDVLISEQEHLSSEGTQVVATAIPSAVDPLAQWLVGQPLVPLTHRGAEVSCIGSEQASLMVVCLHMDNSAQLPLSSKAAQLFDLMMRAIEMPRTGFRQCAILTQLHTQTPDSAAATFLDDILTPNIRAVLVLDPRLHPDPNMSNLDTVLMPPFLLPLWRVSHPDLLLETPSLKRQAWERLKSLKQVLDA